MDQIIAGLKEKAEQLREAARRNDAKADDEVSEVRSAHYRGIAAGYREEAEEYERAVASLSLVVKVAGYVTLTKEDPSSRAKFANSDNAEQYARMLAASGRYVVVCLWDAQGRCWEIEA